MDGKKGIMQEIIQLVIKKGTTYKVRVYITRINDQITIKGNK